MLDRKTTAEDAFRFLDKTDQLTPFAREGGTAIVTGGNSGIGIETVKVLAMAGMNVILCARNLESASNAIKENLPSSVQGKVEVQSLDLADLASVKTSADAILDKCGDSTIDCLVNNAGIMALKNRETSKDGIEMQFAVNHVGHHLLTRLLLPSITTGGRIVNVASTAHTMAKEPIDDWESKESYKPWGAYGTSKLCNILFTKQLQTELRGQQQVDDNKIDVVALHPGVIRTPLWKHTFPRFLQPLVSLFANKSIEQGAATSVYCALSRNIEGGGYYDNCAVAVPSTNARSEKLSTALWRHTEQLLADKGIKLPDMVLSTKSKESALVTE
eukprot:CAMPEP_0194129488 /NCGR_PEP_ID=MMETSP0152-20130528/694_1 /TAXON_ID=1049557 /ORGANISM="Thalassiothrix antarctica, Strain L6-D1" /LENGTH=329 /DNA_ID=CAMNT_0038823689 /DNA_START=112 /DNA_END=1101 /DNA_ORIENTATION=+